MKKSVDNALVPFDANRITQMISFLSKAVRNHPSTVPDGQMTPILQLQAYLEKREQMQHIKALQKFLMKRYKRRAKAQKVSALFLRFFPRHNNNPNSEN